jgi:hypothetical protein
MTLLVERRDTSCDDRHIGNVFASRQVGKTTKPFEVSSYPLVQYASVSNPRRQID